MLQRAATRSRRRTGCARRLAGRRACARATRVPPGRSGAQRSQRRELRRDGNPPATTSARRMAPLSTRAAHLDGPAREVARGRGVEVRAVERDPSATSRNGDRLRAWRARSRRRRAARTANDVRRGDPDERRMVAVRPDRSRREPSRAGRHRRTRPARTTAIGLPPRRHGDRLVAEIPARRECGPGGQPQRRCEDAVDTTRKSAAGYKPSDRPARISVIGGGQRSATRGAPGGDLADHGGVLEALGTEEREHVVGGLGRARDEQAARRSAGRSAARVRRR